MHASHSRAILRLIVLTSILATLLGSAVDTIPARAATFVVTSTADSGPGTLRQAVLDAAPGDSITFSVTGTINLLSQIGIDKNLTISGPGAASLTISGGNAVRIFNIVSVNVNISGLTIANGNAGADNGGGIFNFGGSLTLNNVIFTNNQAPGGSGGAIYQNQGSLTVMNSAFNGSSSATDGAGIMATDLPLMVSNCTFANNTATTGFGGGFRWASGTNSANTLRVLNSTFSNNHAARGSGINRVSSSIDMIANSTFSSNDTTGLGGGLFTAEGTLTLANDTFSANSASSGGCIYSNASSLSLINNTLSANSASTGGGIYSNADSLSLINNILAKSTAGDDCFESNSILNAMHNNLIGSGNCQLNTSLDPRLSTLGNNGGPTQTFALLPDSPAIDNGDNAPARLLR